MYIIEYFGQVWTSLDKSGQVYTDVITQIDILTRSYEWHGCHPVYGSNFNNASYERSWMVDLESQNPG